MLSRRISLLIFCAALASAQTKGSAKSGPAPAAAKPPKPGLVSCAGKIEGRYAEASVGQLQMEFRSGKVTMKALLLGTQTLTCWMQGKKFYLYMDGDPEPMEGDINDDGSLQTPMGELKKKGA